MVASPQFLVIAGCNGAGKTTSASGVLPESIPYINADEIAKELPEDASQNRDFLASRLLLREWDRLEEQRADFAVETTLASRSLAPRIARLRDGGYQIHLLFFWLASPDLAVARVAERVRHGGHDIPEATIRRRYGNGLANFFILYRALVDTWRVFDNSRLGDPRLIAAGSRGDKVRVYDRTVWWRIQREPT